MGDDADTKIALLADLEAGFRRIWESSLRTPPPCGTEKSPHFIGSPKKVGDRVTCLVCGENLVVMPNDRGMSLTQFERELMQPKPLRFAAPADEETFRVPPEFRYTPAFDARVRHPFQPLSIGYNWGDIEPPRVLRPIRLVRPGTISPGMWRLMRREGRANRTRSARRTDFGRRLLG